MTTLLVDIGNSRIKWARLASDGRMSRQRASSYADWSTQDFQRTLFARGKRVDRVVAVSVAPASIERAIADAARGLHIPAPELVRSARSLGGVTTRYAEPWRLGADRLVAAIGAYALSGARACCVVDVGTATTLDLVDARGIHLGGAIVPGPELMVGSLLSDTHGIKRRAAGARRERRTLFARNTRSAIESGADYAVAATIDRAVLEAREELGSPPIVFLTGGAAARVAPLLRTRAVRTVPDLVLRGLAELASRPLR